jgi:YidC/Oxa1 family membrane protein insertase
MAAWTQYLQSRPGCLHSIPLPSRQLPSRRLLNVLDPEGSSMSDVRRALLWGILSISLIMLWDGWQRHRGQPSMFDPTPVAQAPVAAASAVPGSTLPVASAATAASVAPVAAAASAATPVPSQTVTLETDVLKATFDSRGGSLVRLELLKHRGSDAEGLLTADNMRLMDRSAERLYMAESGLIAPGATLPNHLTEMQIQPGERTLVAGVDSLTLNLVSADVGGVKLQKTYTLKRGSYLIDVKETVVNDSATAVSPQLYLQLVRDGNVPKNGTFMGPSSYTGPAVYSETGKFQKVDFKHIEERAANAKPDHEVQADNGWVAMVQHYFTSAWLLNQKAPREFYTRKVENNLYAVGMLLPLGQVAPGASREVQAQLYAGPQEEKHLEALAPGLELVKDYGWLTLLAKPLFWLLNFLHGLIQNWGWSIVALVVLLKIAFYWLNASAYRSMGKMKAVNPKIMEMRERLKDNPQKMQQEMMRIYREEKVNPIGGCLPIFIQMPFFIALYWVLLSSVEMRNAPWIGWITDLSAKDPYFILPLVMTASTLLQTWLNPTPPDPVQARMMWIMPLVFSVMFFVFPAGLVLYWVTNNLLSIAQQWMINRQLGIKH